MERIHQKRVGVGRPGLVILAAPEAAFLRPYRGFRHEGHPRTHDGADLRRLVVGYIPVAATAA